MGYKTNFQKKKLVVDTAFSNGLNWTRAYMEIMGVEKPELAKRAVYKMKQTKEVVDYIQFKESELELKGLPIPRGWYELSERLKNE